MPKTRKRYSADELKQLNKRLIEHRDALADKISSKLTEFWGSKSFDHAVEIRDLAQLLTTTCVALSHMKVITSLAEMSGPQIVPYLEDCGLE